MVSERNFDTQFPLNVNDSDLWPEMTEPPQPREGCTEMMFDLVRYEVGKTVRTLGAMQKFGKAQSAEGLQMQDDLLERLKNRLEQKYLRHCDLTNPLQWVCAHISRLVCESTCSLYAI